MGILIPVLVYGDELESVQNNPKEFVDSIYERSVGYNKDPYLGGPGVVLKARHMDSQRVLFVWQNRMVDLSDTVQIEAMSSAELQNLKVDIKAAEESLEWTKKCLNKKLNEKRKAQD